MQSDLSVENGRFRLKPKSGFLTQSKKGFLPEQRLDELSSQRVGGFGLSRKPPKLRSWSCAQLRAAKAAAGAAVVGSMGSIPRAAAVV